MRYIVNHGEYGTGGYYISDESDKGRDICGIVAKMFDGDAEKAKQMAIKICQLLNQDDRAEKELAL